CGWGGDADGPGLGRRAVPAWGDGGAEPGGRADLSVRCGWAGGVMRVLGIGTGDDGDGNAAPPSSDRFAATFSLKERKVTLGSACARGLPEEPLLPLRKRAGVRGAQRLRNSPVFRIPR